MALEEDFFTRVHETVLGPQTRLRLYQDGSGTLPNLFNAMEEELEINVVSFGGRLSC